MSLRPDLVILSGDVVDEGEPAEYAVARELLATLDLPLAVIPGNHDQRDAFRACFSAHAYLPATGPCHWLIENRDAVRVIGLDIAVPGLHHGQMDEAAGLWLDGALAREPERPTIIVMHQPPFASQIPFVDAYLCREGERLATIVGRYPALERIACGHVHRFMLVRFGATMLCTSPSTTTAIALALEPGAALASFVEPPAFLLHHWTPGAGLVSHLVPIGRFQDPTPSPEARGAASAKASLSAQGR